jgi:hypothetical protein
MGIMSAFKNIRLRQICIANNYCVLNMPPILGEVPNAVIALLKPVLNGLI